MEKRWCNACGEVFDPRPQAPRQSYCVKPECQRSRKRLWQQIKRKSDIDYQQNQVQAQSKWRGKNPDYWRRYRDSHPEYTEKNRQQQTRRNTQKLEPTRELQIANSDASMQMHFPAGIYKIVAIAPATWAGCHEWLVQIGPVPST